MSEQIEELSCAAFRVDFGTEPAGEIRYSFATLVNDRAQFDEMVSSFSRGGFGPSDCEFLFIDNTGDTQTCAYRGLNEALVQARGRYVILCHQDVRLLRDGRVALDARLSELDEKDPGWGIAGNAGGVRPGRLAMRISDPHGADQHVGTLPAPVKSVDENFIVVKSASRVGFSNDISGFHLYGADLCLNGEVSGWRAYVIDFHLQHLSAGRKDDTFYQTQAAFCAKWDRALRPRFLQTTCTLAWVGGSRILMPLRRLGEFVVHKALRLGTRVERWRNANLSARLVAFLTSAPARLSRKNG